MVLSQFPALRGWKQPLKKGEIDFRKKNAKMSFLVTFARKRTSLRRPIWPPRWRHRTFYIKGLLKFGLKSTILHKRVWAEFGHLLPLSGRAKKAFFRLFRRFVGLPEGVGSWNLDRRWVSWERRCPAIFVQLRPSWLFFEDMVRGGFVRPKENSKNSPENFFWSFLVPTRSWASNVKIWNHLFG